MSGRATTARRLLERTGGHPVVTLDFDLDPREFATAPAADYWSPTELTPAPPTGR
jgi:hypothetical protein